MRGSARRRVDVHARAAGSQHLASQLQSGSLTLVLAPFLNQIVGLDAGPQPTSSARLLLPIPAALTIWAAVSREYANRPAA